MINQSRGHRSGTILIIVAGLSALLALLVMAFLVRVRADAEETTALQHMAQARVMLTSAILFIMETQGAAATGSYDLHVLKQPSGSVSLHTVYTPADGASRRSLSNVDPLTSPVASASPKSIEPWSAGLSWFRIKKSGNSFLVTVGAGQSGGVGPAAVPAHAKGLPATWSEIAGDASLKARFSSSEDVYNTILSSEYRAWYQVEWEPITIAPKTLPELCTKGLAAYPLMGPLGSPAGESGSFSQSSDAWRQFGRIKSITAVDPATLIDGGW